MTPSGREPGTPWYRHFWPWFIVLLMGISVVSSLATVVVAYRGADPVVRDDWYKDGVAINRRLELERRARDLGLSARVEQQGARGHLVVALQGPGSDEVPALRLMLSHATLAARDLSLVLDRIAPGRFEATTTGPLDGRWYATLEPIAPGDPSAQVDWRLEGSFSMPSPAPIVLGDGG